MAGFSGGTSTWAQPSPLAVPTTSEPRALGPALAQGQTELPTGKRDMGGWSQRVYTTEQQQRLRVDESGRPLQDTASASSPSIQQQQQPTKQPVVPSSPQREQSPSTSQSQSAPQQKQQQKQQPGQPQVEQQSPQGSPSRNSSASGRRMPPRKARRPSPEDLERKFRELEAFKKEGEKRKKDMEKVTRKQAMQEKQSLNRALQQASRVANSRQADVARIIRKLEKVEAEQERQSTRKLQTQEKFDEDLRKLREERYNVGQQYEVKLAEVAEARSRLEYLSAILQDEDDTQEEDQDETAETNPEEREEQERLMAEAERIRQRIREFTGENSRLKKDVEEMRKSLKLQQSQAPARQNNLGENGAIEKAGDQQASSGGVAVSASAVRSQSADPHAAERPVSAAQSNLSMTPLGGTGTPQAVSARAPVGSPLSMASSSPAAPSPVPSPVRAEAVPGVTAGALAGVAAGPGTGTWTAAPGAPLPGTTRIMSPASSGHERVLRAGPATIQSFPPSMMLAPPPGR